MKNNCLRGKKIAITGASSGLGAHFARLCAAQGATVAMMARRMDKLEEIAKDITALGGAVLPMQLDVCDLDMVRSVLTDCQRKLNGIDILINNSGVSSDKRTLDIEPEDYDSIVAVNMRGAFFVAQTTARLMIESGISGRIVNVASAGALRPMAGLCVYGMTKAAIVHMTKTMALEWARKGLSVNALCPGYIETEINEQLWASDAGQRIINGLPRKRLGKASYLDAVLLALIADEHDFVTGSVIVADDGWSVS